VRSMADCRHDTTVSEARLSVPNALRMVVLLSLGLWAAIWLAVGLLL
jgi:hypothetical protein